MRIVGFSSPHRNAVGRIDFAWPRSGTSIPFHLIVARAGARAPIEAELISNIDSNASPESFRALPMQLVSDDGERAIFAIDVPVERLGNYRVFARAREVGDPRHSTTRDAGLPDLLFRPRDPSIANLRIEVISVPNANDGTFAGLTDPSGRYTLEWLSDMGKNCVWLLPIFEPSSFARLSKDDATGSPYAPLDFFSLRVGLSRAARGRSGEDAEKAAFDEYHAFIDRAHALGIKVVLDIALNHVGIGHLFRDLFVDGTKREVRANDFSNVAFSDGVRAEIAAHLADPSRPKTLEWIAPWMFGSHKEFPKGASAPQRIAPGGWFEWMDVRQLNHGRKRVHYREFIDASLSDEHAAVQGWLERVLRYWAVDMRADGFRLDHLAGLPRRMLEVALNRMQADVDSSTPGRNILIVGEDYDTASETQHFVDVLQAGWFTEIASAQSNEDVARIVDDPWFAHLLALSCHDEDRPCARWSSEQAQFYHAFSYLLGGPVMEVMGDSLAARARLEVRTTKTVPEIETPSEGSLRIASALASYARIGRELEGRPRRWLPARSGMIAFARGDKRIEADLTTHAIAISDDAPSIAVKPEPVRVTFEAERGRKVELMGDFIEWKRPTPMSEVAPGRYAVEMMLAPGVYRYKLLLDGREWRSDPKAALADDLEGSGNALLVFGGSTDPIVFAPDAQHVHLRADGRFVLHAEASVSGQIPSYVRLWKDGTPIADVPLFTVHEAQGRRLLRAEAILSAVPDEISFDRHRFLLPEPQGPPPSTDPWWAHAVFYGIFVDRWLRGSKRPLDRRASSRRAASTWSTYYGGDLYGIAESLDELVDLGVDAIVLTPIHTSDSPHRYDAIDLALIDARLGGDKGLRCLIDGAHARGLKVVLDLSITHVDERHFAFRDLLEHQERSRYRDWFKVRRFPVIRHDGDSFELYPNQLHLPMLNLDCRAVRDHIFAIAEDLVKRGIDGLRFDAMNDAPADLWRELRARLVRIRPDVCILGEVVIDRPHRFLGARGADLATDFDLKEAMLDFFARGRIDAAELHARTTWVRHRKGPFGPERHLAFLDNHDTSRFASIAGFFDRTRLALAYLIFRPEPIWITYGTELNFSRGGGDRALDDAWPDRLPMPEPGSEETSTKKMMRALLALRRSSPALRGGTLHLVQAEGHMIALERRGEGEILRGYFNSADEAAAIGELPLGAELVISIGEERPSIRSMLAPRSARIYRIPSPNARPEARTRRTLKIVDEAFRSQKTRPDAPPTRFYLNLTELCNIRCAHCITHAPELTYSGVARAMSAEVLKRLEPHLREATYVGFTHAGEPTIAPQLIPVLEMLRTAKAGEPVIVHLLTNGKTLNVSRFMELADLGVSSFSISIDGVSPKTHDALRLGSSVEALIENLRMIAPLRRGRDLRMGFAFTVTRDNLGEIPALIALAAELELDWIKLEEVFPVNAVGVNLVPDEAQLFPALERARSIASRARIPLLDHTRDIPVLKCRLDDDPRAREFSLLDDYVNRMEINSCRLPWEMVCVEPNGDVKPISFHHPACGNIMTSDLLDIFRKSFFVAARSESIRRWVCGGKPTCAPDRGPSGW